MSEERGGHAVAFFQLAALERTEVVECSNQVAG